MDLYLIDIVYIETKNIKCLIVFGIVYILGKGEGKSHKGETKSKNLFY